MAKTYAQLAKEIESLTKAAAALRKQEIPTVVTRIKEAIGAYGLTAADLGFTDVQSEPAAPRQVAAAPAAAKKAKKPAGSPGKVPVKYRDGNGNSWTGRGSKPGWLQAALSAGQSLEAFSVDTDTDAGAAAASAPPAGGERPAPKSKPAKSASTAKYKDEAGHTWSGFGPKPGWLKAALADGKTLEQMAAS